MTSIEMLRGAMVALQRGDRAAAEMLIATVQARASRSAERAALAERMGLRSPAVRNVGNYQVFSVMTAEQARAHRASGGR